MSSSFEKNEYLDAVKDTVFFETELIASNSSKSRLQFKYGDIGYSKFNTKYKSEGWIGRKIIALPAMVWSAVVKTIYHFAKALFIGTIVAFSDKGKYFKANCFSLARDLQESFGWLMTLFSDRYGQYQVQKSGFHKSCYEYFLIDRPSVNQLNQSPVEVQDLRSINNDEASQVNIAKANIEDEPNPVTEPTEEDKLDTEFEQIAKVNYDERDPLYLQVAEKYLSMGLADKALNTVKKSYNSNLRETFVVKVADFYLAQGNLERSIEIVKTSYVGYKSEEVFFAKVAESYYAKGDFEKAVNAIEKADSKTKQAFLVKVANTYLSQGNRVKALEAIKKYYGIDTGTKEDFFIQVAESYHSAGESEKALEILKEIYLNSEKKEPIITKIVNDYLFKRELDKAAKVLNELSFTSRRKDLFLQLAESYYAAERLDDAMEIIKKMIGELKACEQLIMKIVDAYLKKNELVNAFNALSRVDDSHKKFIYLLRIAQLFLKENKDISGIIQQIVRDLFRKKFLMSYFKICSIGLNQNLINSFFLELANQCLSSIKQSLSDRKPEEILEEIENKFISPEIEKKFLDLETKHTSSRNNANPGFQYFNSNAGSYFQNFHPQSNWNQYYPNGWGTFNTQPGSQYFYTQPQPGPQYFYTHSQNVSQPPVNDNLSVEYGILGLQPTETKEAIVKKYKTLVKTYHPDKTAQNEGDTPEDFKKRQKESEDKFKSINDAYKKIQDNGYKFQVAK